MQCAGFEDSPRPAVDFGLDLAELGQFKGAVADLEVLALRVGKPES